MSKLPIRKVKRGVSSRTNIGIAIGVLAVIILICGALGWSLGRNTINMPTLPSATTTFSSLSTETPLPLFQPTNTSQPTSLPTNTPLPTITPTFTPLPTNTPRPTETPTSLPTNTPLPTSTPKPSLRGGDTTRSSQDGMTLIYVPGQIGRAHV